MPRENGDIINMLILAGIPSQSLMNCEVVAVGGVLLASRRWETSITRIEEALTQTGLKIVWFDLPDGHEPLERHQREAAMDTAVVAMLSTTDGKTASVPFLVTVSYMLVLCDEGTMGTVLDTLPREMAAAGYGGLPLLVVDVEISHSIIHCATMSESVPSQVLTEESMDELSRLLSSTGSVEEFLNALK